MNSVLQFALKTWEGNNPIAYGYAFIHHPRPCWNRSSTAILHQAKPLLQARRLTPKDYVFKLPKALHSVVT